jgi:TM2 domain-containing membrane protein YozV
MYCQKCGAELNVGARYCQKCGTAATSVGASQHRYEPYSADEPKNWTITLLLALIGFLGIGGIQRFYTGHIGLGVLYLLTGGLCGIGTIIDIIMILTGSYTDAKGRPLVK